MSRLILGTGEYAREPYYLEKLYRNIYSVEELCYVLTENAEILDQEVMQKKLIQWLDEQCGLNQLAHSLYALLNQKASAVAFVGTILEYVNLYPEEVIDRTEQTIKGNEGLNPYERKKAKIDFLLGNKRYFAVLEQYPVLLEQIPKEQVMLRAQILHNMGVACAGMFLFEQAAKWFEQAYAVGKSQDSLIQYLAALRMHYQDKEYITFIAEHPEYHDASLKVERLVEQATGQFEGTDENRMLYTLQICKEEGSNTAGVNVAYYDEMEHLTGKLKAQYREYIM